MAPESAVDVPGELEQRRCRFEEFRKTRPGHARLPEDLWTAAAELAKRYGVNPTARALRLEYGGLRKRVENRATPNGSALRQRRRPSWSLLRREPKRLRTARWKCESAQGGKLRLELKAVTTTELVSLIRAFVNQ